MEQANDKVVRAILKEIDIWRKNKKRIIIGIDGSTGTGKSSIARRIVELSEEKAFNLHLDNFRQIPSLFYKNWYDLAKIKKELKKNKEKIIILDGVFLKSEDLKEILHKIIFLEIDKNEALERRERRRLIRNKKEIKKEVLEAFLKNWDNYLKKEKPQDTCNLHIKMKVVEK